MDASRKALIMSYSKFRHGLLFVFGTILPVAALSFELFARLCAGVFFDPVPSVAHVLLVAAVPAGNAMLWWRLRGGNAHYSSTLDFLSAFSIGVALTYTIIFLPITALAIVAILFFGLGLLALAPLLSLIAAIVLRMRYRKAAVAGGEKRAGIWLGIATAAILLVVLDIPYLVTTQGIQWAASESRETSLRGIRLLRSIGNEDQLLRRCYDRDGVATGPLTFALQAVIGNDDPVPTDKVREIFYRVTGEPFNLRPPPYSRGGWSDVGGFDFDPDQGGTNVGGRIKGLHLSSSRMDGSVSAADGVAYLEWTLEFENQSGLEREVRLQLALPPDSVVSRATLWIDDEEREAAFAGRSEATRAYRSIVQRMRDPLLVTTRGRDRIQAQAFPLAPNGGRIKFRLGITAPLNIVVADKLRFVLPSIVNRNFTIGDRVVHNIWIEGDRPMTASLPEFTESKPAPQVFRISAEAGDAALASVRPYVAVESAQLPSGRWSRANDRSFVAQRIVKRRQESADALMIVLDGSSATDRFAEDIANALDSIPANSNVGLIIATEPEIAVPLNAWSTEHRELLLETLRATDFVGGQDNGSALARALVELERFDRGELLWIHMPQPISFAAGGTTLEQTLSRLSRLPTTTFYSLAPGPNRLLETGGWSIGSRTLPRLIGPAADLGTYFESVLTPTVEPVYVRNAVADVGEFSEGSGHIARLWAYDEIRSLLREKPPNYRERAISLAAEYQLVTSVSGAVVLENAGQYRDNNLTPVDPGTVPTIPEPEQWILALIVLAMMLWMLKEHARKRSLYA